MNKLDKSSKRSKQKKRMNKDVSTSIEIPTDDESGFHLFHIDTWYHNFDDLVLVQTRGFSHNMTI